MLNFSPKIRLGMFEIRLTSSLTKLQIHTHHNPSTS